MPYCPHCGGEVDLQDLEARDNTFREDPDPNQTSLAELAGDGSSEGSDDLSVWDRVDDLELTDLEIREPDLQPGEAWNEADPAKW